MRRNCRGRQDDWFPCAVRQHRFAEASRSSPGATTRCGLNSHYLGRLRRRPSMPPRRDRCCRMLRAGRRRPTCRGHCRRRREPMRQNRGDCRPLRRRDCDQSRLAGRGRSPKHLVVELT
jgi:hypothetical protein